MSFSWNNGIVKSTPELYLIVCTRNRYERAQNLVLNILEIPDGPEQIIVVDSSTIFRGFSLPRNAFDRVIHIKSEPGLPFQRNLGIELAKRIGDPEILAFLDDDVSVPHDYFQNVRSEFQIRPDAACIAGFDSNLHLRDAHLFEKMVFLRGVNDQGKLLASGIAVPVTQINGLLQTDWAPGHSLNVALWALSEVRFNARIRMYGEDVEFLIRLSKQGPIYTSSKLGIQHNPEPSGRDAAAPAEMFNAGFRWWLAAEYPEKFSRMKVLVSSGALMFGYLIKAIAGADALALARAKGLKQFFCNLIKGEMVTQTEH
jgi:GT2 family glycosyltransferase